MLETTFLGHQGWMFATGQARILVDPLLVEEFGHKGAAGVVWPPRRWDISAMPPVDAVFFTHEHEDHFNIPSVNRLSREIPIHVPERSSRAMKQFLQEAGFKVVAMSSGQTVEFADLRFTTFAPDHVHHDEQDEWETTPFLVEDAAGGGSFFSPVDVTVSDAMWAMLKQRGAAPALWGYANNVLNLSFQEQPLRAAPAVEPIIARFVAEHKRRPPPPAASLMCGGGFSFNGSRAWMNHAVFPLDSDQLFGGLQAVSQKERFIVPTPGMRIVCEGAAIESTADSSPFLGTPPRGGWPDRTYRPKATPQNTVEPACGRAELKAGELEDLTQALADFAAFLYGGPLFRILYSLGAPGLPANIRPIFAINAMSGKTDHVFEYDPAGCRFELSKKPNPMSAYAAGIECFATDLLDFLNSRLAPSALMFGRLIRWRNTAENTTGAIDYSIWAYCHPLRRPSQYLEFYRDIHAREPKDVPTVRGKSG
jgi:hypothetical protein